MTAQDLSPDAVATAFEVRKEELDGSTSNNDSANANQAQLIANIKAHIAKGDKLASKANDHYISAGQYLATLKKEHAGSWAEWEELLKTKIRISTGRASELMQIADGRKTVEGVRAGKNETSKIAHAKERAARSSLNSEDNADDPEASAEVMKEKLAASGVETVATSNDTKGRKQLAKKKTARKQSTKKTTGKPKRSASQDRRALEAKQAHIDELEAAREHDQDLAEQLRLAEIKIAGLEGEIEDLKDENAALKDENAALRVKLEAAQKVAS